MAHFIRKDKLKLGLLTLISNISESCGRTKATNIAFESPDRWFTNSRRTGLQQPYRLSLILIHEDAFRETVGALAVWLLSH